LKSSRFAAPRLLKPGGTIGVMSQSGAVDPARLARGVSRLEGLGYRVVLADDVAGSHEYFSAPDDVRLASLHKLIADPSVDMLMMSRGGYGLSRIVHRIDWNAVRQSQKIFCGFSDFTAFNLAALAQANTITLAGPGVAVDFGDESYDGESAADHDFMQRHWQQVIHHGSDAVEVACAHPYAAQQHTGPLWGSNLSLLAHAVGTSFMPDVVGGILFIEEIDEQPYAVERMFMQLYHAGILQTQRALVLGGFTDCEPPDNGRFPYAMSHVIATLRQLLPCPVLTDLPFGHVQQKLTLPFGADATLDITSDGYRLAF
jgi:muramoyltetrapeptide carboxypeptidase